MVKSKAKALRHFKFDPVLKNEATFHCCLDLCELHSTSNKEVLGTGTAVRGINIKSVKKTFFLV